MLRGFLPRIMKIEPIRRQSSLAFLSTILITAIGFVSTMLFAHLLGPELMGGYFLFLAYYGIAELYLDGGLGSAAVKRISEGREQEEYFTAFLFLRILLLVLLLIALALARELFVDLNQEGLFVPFLLTLATGLFYSVGFNAHVGAGNVGISKAGELLNYLVKVSAQVVAVLLGLSLYGLVGGFICGLIAGALVYWRSIRLRIKRFGTRHIRSLAIYSFWVFLTASGYVIFSYTDVILIGYFLGNTEVGIYRVVMQLTSAGTFTAAALQIALFPRISRWSFERDFISIEKALTQALSYAQFLAIPVFFGGIVLGDRLLYYLYGAAFTEGAAFLPILLLSQVVNVCLMLLSSTLYALNHPEMTFRATLAAAGLNLILNFLLIPVFGMIGAAVATFVAISLNAFLSWWFLSREIAVRPDKRALGNILIAACAMLVIVALLRTVMPDAGVFITIGTVLIGAFVYMLILFRLERWMKEELLNIFRQFGLPVPLFIERF